MAFFLGMNIILGRYFLENHDFYLPKKVANILVNSGIIEKNKSGFLYDEIKKEVESSLEPQIILEKLNVERRLFEVGELEYNDSLASAAAILLEEAAKYDYDLDSHDFLAELKNALIHVGYEYSHVSHNTMVGPMLEQAVVDAWFSNAQQIEAMKDDDFTQVGFATKIVGIKDIGTVGVIVQVLGRPMNVTPTKPQQTQSPIVFPEISDEEIVDALNSYRLVHDVRTLNIDQNLCQYASKRVQDLIVFGSLDEHAGFKKDFDDQDNLPEPIRNYSGTEIAENLAHQYCKNMTTGDSFIAETGTSIIEWCFDSSTKGHKEAQLNNDYENVCVRHGEHMYVVIFGD
ncbi:hypothetical protein KKD03_04245 [Patescibacteria group bacterium]|nr:hypothetical protein [Patescibacteria group bacterium]